jgi:RimJ/RimL family protein N-acetyltransferase
MELLPDLVVADGLTLRCYVTEDAEALVNAVTESLEHLRPWMPWIAFEPQSVGQRQDWIGGVNRERDAGGDVVLGIFDGDELVGGTGLHRRAEPTALEIGYWVHVAHCGRRVARRAAAALTSAAFALHETEHVDIRHDRKNVASRRVPEGLGYRLVEEARRPPEAPAESGLLLRWRVARHEWDIAP